MPELPEVEIVKQSLNKNITHRKVKKVIVRNRNLRFKIPSNFESYLKNKKIIKVDRFSKYLIIYLSGDGYCLIHLGIISFANSISLFGIHHVWNLTAENPSFCF